MLYFFNQRKKDVKRLGGNYEKEIFRHLQETLGKVDRLTEEVTSIKREHQKEIAFLKAENLKLQRENIALKSENAKLKEIINKNSSNSSKPPSSDGFVKIQNSREKSGKRPGGQFGHKGHKPKLYENHDEIIEIKAEHCSCGVYLKYDGTYTAKQIVDVEIETTIKEYRE